MLRWITFLETRNAVGNDSEGSGDQKSSYSLCILPNISIPTTRSQFLPRKHTAAENSLHIAEIGKANLGPNSDLRVLAAIRNCSVPVIWWPESRYLVTYFPNLSLHIILFCIQTLVPGLATHHLQTVQCYKEHKFLHSFFQRFFCNPESISFMGFVIAHKVACKICMYIGELYGRGIHGFH